MFFGTPASAVPTMSALLASDIEVVAVVTNPDRPAHRGLRERTTPVKDAALAAGIEVLQPERVRDPSFHRTFTALRPDVACVVAYGKILPVELLEVPPLGFVNAHFSLLPSYRGAAPVQWALINGDTHTGVSIMVLSEGMDEGPLLASEEVFVDEADTAGSLQARLASHAAPLMIETLQGYADGLIIPQPQDDHRASFAPKLTAEDVRVEWSRPARDIRNLIRGANPEPGAWTTFRGRRLKLLNASECSGSEVEPGALKLTPTGLFVGTGDGRLRIEQGQMQGRRPLPGAELGRGLQLRPGDRCE